MSKLLVGYVITCLLTVSGLTGAAHAADIKVLSDGPLRSVLTSIAERFQRESEHRIHLSFDPGPALRARIVGGEIADILITPASEVEELTRQGKVIAESKVPVARVSIGLAIREGVPVPDISTLESLKETLLRAESLIFTTLGSGAQFLKVVERLGIAEDAKTKSTQLPNGAAVFDEVLKRNSRDIGVGLITQIMEYGPKGLRLIGPLPPELHSPTVFVANVLASTKAAGAAREFIRYLQTPESQAAFAAAGAG